MRWEKDSYLSFFEPFILSLFILSSLLGKTDEEETSDGRHETSTGEKKLSLRTNIFTSISSIYVHNHVHHQSSFLFLFKFFMMYHVSWIMNNLHDYNPFLIINTRSFKEEFLFGERQSWNGRNRNRTFATNGLRLKRSKPFQRLRWKTKPKNELEIGKEREKDSCSTRG